MSWHDAIRFLILGLLIGPFLIALLGLVFWQRAKWLFLAALFPIVIVLLLQVALLGWMMWSGTAPPSAWGALLKGSLFIPLQSLVLIGVYRECVDK